MKKAFLVLFIFQLTILVAFAQKLENIDKLTPVPSNIGKFSKRLAKVRNKYLDLYKINFSVSTESLNLPNNKKVIGINIRVNWKDIVFASIGGKNTAKIKIYGRITSKDKKIDGFFEEQIEEFATHEELADGLNKYAILRKVFDLPDGNYQIGVIISDIYSGNRDVKVVKFKVSQILQPKLKSSN